MKPYKTAITIELKEVTQTITAAAYRLHDKHSAQGNELMTSHHLVPKTAVFGLPLCLLQAIRIPHTVPKTESNCTYIIT